MELNFKEKKFIKDNFKNIKFNIYESNNKFKDVNECNRFFKNISELMLIEFKVEGSEFKCVLTDIYNILGGVDARS